MCKINKLQVCLSKPLKYDPRKRCKMENFFEFEIFATNID